MNFDINFDFQRRERLGLIEAIWGQDKSIDQLKRLSENVLSKKSSLILNHKKKYHITTAETDEEICRGEPIGYEKLWVKSGISEPTDTWLTEKPYYC